MDMQVSILGGVSDVYELMFLTGDEQRVAPTKVFAVFETPMYSFCGMDLPVQNRILELCRERLISVRSVSVYPSLYRTTREWPTPESVMMT